MKNTILSVAIAKQVNNGDLLPIPNQKRVDDDQDLNKYLKLTDSATKQVFWVLSLREFPARTWNMDHKRTQEKSKKAVGDNAFGSSGCDDNGNAEGNMKGKGKAKQKRKVANKLVPFVERDANVQDLSLDNDVNLGLLAKKSRTSSSKDKPNTVEQSIMKLTRKTKLHKGVIV